MKKTNTLAKIVAGLSIGALALVGCGDDGGGDDGSSSTDKTSETKTDGGADEKTKTKEANCGAEGGCPGGENGCPGGENGCPADKKG